jgi:tRNA A37 methylthiotransferase MiaB
MCLSSSAEDVLRIIKAFEKKFIVTNVMTGYPGEIETDFQAQLKLIDDKGLYFIQVNQYDNTPYVPASALKQVPKEISDLRLLELFRTINQVKSRKAESIIGSEVECVYTLEGNLEVLGYTAEVILNGSKHDQYFYGQSIKVRIKSFNAKKTNTNPYMYIQLEGVEV